MIIRIHLAAAATMEDIDNFAGFKVVAVCGTDQVAQGLTNVGRLDGNGHAWISRSWLLANGRPDDAKWLTGFRAMHDYAANHGWVDAATDSIRAHIEYASS